MELHEFYIKYANIPLALRFKEIDCGDSIHTLSYLKKLLDELYKKRIIILEEEKETLKIAEIIFEKLKESKIESCNCSGEELKKVGFEEGTFLHAESCPLRKEQNESKGK